MQWVFTPAALKMADWGMGTLLLGLAALGCSTRFYKAWAGVFVLVLMYSISSFYSAGKWHAGWHLVSSMSRAVFPLLLFWWGGRQAGARQLQMVLRGLLALVFGSHGVLALLQTPDFIDYVLGTAFHLSGQYVEEGWARVALYGIGVLDLLTAMFLFLRPKAWILGWALAWISLTLSMRLLTGGWMNYTEVLVRLPYLWMSWFLLLQLRVLRRDDVSFIQR
jgi:hypothetical protein